MKIQGMEWYYPDDSITKTKPERKKWGDWIAVVVERLAVTWSPLKATSYNKGENSRSIKRIIKNNYFW